MMITLFASGECSSHESVVEPSSEVGVWTVDTSQRQQQSLVTFTDTGGRERECRVDKHMTISLPLLLTFFFYTHTHTRSLTQNPQKIGTFEGWVRRRPDYTHTCTHACAHTHTHTPKSLKGRWQYFTDIHIIAVLHEVVGQEEAPLVKL